VTKEEERKRRAVERTKAWKRLNKEKVLEQHRRRWGRVREALRMVREGVEVEM